MKQITKLTTILVALFLSIGTAYAQDIAIKGSVSAEGEPLIGAYVVEKGTMNGTSTDADGLFSLKVNPGAIIEVSYLGYTTLSVEVGNKVDFKFELQPDSNTLDAVIAIGYGVQKKKLNTAATAQVAGDDLKKENTINAFQALQGKAAGVQITQSSGQPGKGMNMTIRGIGSIGGSSPIYIVDGVQTGDISYLSNSDIESIDILKDAASAAIYGAQASNGVVLITTKSGNKGRAQISFDGYYGIQNLPNNNVQALNASDYAMLVNEGRINSGKAPLYTTDKASFLAQYGDTNWLKEMTTSNAPTYDYNLGVNGGNEASIYSLSLGITGQDGIFGGHKYSSYQRYNFRANSEHNLYKNVITIGEHAALSYTNTSGINEGGIYSGSPIRSALGTTPLLPMYDDFGNYLNNTANSSTYNGKTWVPWLEGEANPYAAMTIGESHSNNMKVIGDVYLEVKPIRGLKLKTLFGIDYYASKSRGFTPVYQLSSLTYNNNDFATQNQSQGMTWNWDSTISYDLQAGDHAFTVLGGFEMRSYHGEWMYTKNADLIIADYEHAYINNATNTSNSTLWSFQGAPSDESMTMSYFARASYNYKERYMINATFRADGSSRFAASNRWGYFPSVSAGWNISNEDWMKSSSDWLDFLRLRASWGQVGNQNISAWQYLAPIKTDNTFYYFGQGIVPGSLIAPGSTYDVAGAYPNRMSNENLKWETSEQTDIGIDARFFNSRLGVTADYYNKVTKDWLIQAPVLATTGADAPYINGGDVVNSGAELTLSWKDQKGDFFYGISVNGAYNHNEVRNIPTESHYIAGSTNAIYNNAEAAYRKAEEGFPIGYFWGYQTDGLLQNDAEVEEYVASLKGNKTNSLQGTNIAPGDVRFVDRNGDGRISEDDKTMIGKPTPDFTFGLQLNLAWKGLDFSVSGYGMSGNDVFQSYRNQDLYPNYTTANLGRWCGEGTSTTIPRITDTNINYFPSDLFVKDAAFFRISNIQLGYDFSKLIKWKYLEQLRLYVAVNNLYTFTGYDGYDPEVGFGTDSSTSGFDLGFYPRPRTILFGINVKF